MKLTAVAAISKNLVIGKDNSLPWNIPEDLKRFKELTTGSPIVMGRKTFESIGRPLPNRMNIILSQKNYKSMDDVKIFNSLEDFLKFCENLRKEIVDLSIKFQDHNIKVTMSGGVASSDEIDNLEDLINLADERLYEAKEGGRNQIIFRK